MFTIIAMYYICNTAMYYMYNKHFLRKWVWESQHCGILVNCLTCVGYSYFSWLSTNFRFSEHCSLAKGISQSVCLSLTTGWLTAIAGSHSHILQWLEWEMCLKVGVELSNSVPELWLCYCRPWQKVWAHSSIVGNPIAVANLLYKVLSVQMKLWKITLKHVWFTPRLGTAPSGGTKKVIVCECLHLF